MIEKLLKANHPLRVHVLENKTITYKFKNQKLDIIEENLSKIYYVRSIKNGKLGSAYCYSEEDILETYNRSLKHTIPINTNDFPEMKSQTSVFYEKSLRNTVIEELKEALIIESKNLILQEIEITYKETKQQILDTNGEELVSEKNMLSIDSSITLPDREIWYGNSGQDPRFLIKDVKNTLEQRMENTENSVKFSGTCDICFSHEQSSNMIDIILDGFIGKEVEEKNTWSWDKFGKQIFSEITIKEIPKVPLPLATDFDDDGTKTKEKELVDKGVLKNPVYDFYSGIKYGKDTTGNGFFVPENSHGIGFTNIEVSGEETEFENGILAYDVLGFHTCNEITGDLKLVISLGALVKNGEVMGGVRNLGLSGNLIQFMKNVKVTKNKKTYQHYYIPELIIHATVI